MRGRDLQKIIKSIVYANTNAHHQKHWKTTYTSNSKTPENNAFASNSKTPEMTFSGVLTLKVFRRG